jgi:hypothetical protein
MDSAAVNYGKEGQQKVEMLYREGAWTAPESLSRYPINGC